MNLVYAAVAICEVAVTIWAIVDVVLKPRWAFQAAFSSKIALIVSLAITGMFSVLYYIFSLRTTVTKYATHPDRLIHCHSCRRAYPPGSIFCVYCSAAIDNDSWSHPMAAPI